jgi:heme oxygenase (biliverdin-producing, ferredoxin)
LGHSESIAKDFEWFREQGIPISERSPSGLIYADYLNELSESNAHAFLSHYYNIYFAHITGSMATGSKVTPCLDLTQFPLPSLFNFDHTP